jgi:FkbM family methyltransferase
MTSNLNEPLSIFADWTERQSLIKTFISDPSIEKFVFGCNQMGRRISDLIKISGFIDDKTSQVHFNDVPVIRSTEIPKDAIVVSAIVGVSPVSVERYLNSLEVSHVDYFSFMSESGLDLAPIPFWGDARADMMANHQRYTSLLDRMVDDESKKVMSDFIDFRQTLDLRFLESYDNRQAEQYFENFLGLERSGLNFFDLGCFDGYTSSEFARLSPHYGSISAFEPIPRLFEECASNLKPLRDCTVHNFGASNRTTETMFTDDGSSSAHSTTGEVVVQLRKLDDENLPLPDLVKIDIEGSEIPALEGMRETLLRSQSALAVACYHYPNEMLDIVDFWDKCGLKGNLHVRHYTEGTTETVVFLVPE